jgi:DNA-directed RNA polymerase subunit RPC12/RpoP
VKFKLVCTECSEKFTIPGDVAWDGIECPACEFKGNVIGRIVEGEPQFFEDETVTKVIPVVEVPKDA